MYTYIRTIRFDIVGLDGSLTSSVCSVLITLEVDGGEGLGGAGLCVESYIKNTYTVIESYYRHNILNIRTYMHTNYTNTNST